MQKLDITFAPTFRKSTGSHYTPSALAKFVAKNILDQFPQKSKKQTLRIVDPAVGDGELLFAAISEAYSRGFHHLVVTGFDINAEAIEATRRLISENFPQVKLILREEDFLQFALERSSAKDDQFDAVIANPPYVRTQVMGSSKSKELATSFDLSGRVDLYHAFLKGIEKILESDGVVGIIVSNRFMTTKSGESVRTDLLQKFQIQHIWDLGDTRLFEAAVLPAVLLLRKPGNINSEEETRFSSVYLSDNQQTVSSDSVFEALEGVPHESLKVLNGTLSYRKGGDVWRLSTKQNNEWLETVKRNTKLVFRDLGKIRVGIKTTADSVFIVSDLSRFTSGVPETLRPLITHHIAERYRAKKPVKHVVYTHEVQNGKKKPIDLGEYPLTAKYLESHRDALSGRTYIAASGRNWYEIWVPQNPSDWERPKLVFRDISERPMFWMDRSGCIVNGDCYWLTLDSDRNENLLWLALAVANSSFIEEFYDHNFNNKLYSGRRRFITQYVEKFPLPDPSHKTSSEIVEITKRLYKLSSGKEFEGLERDLNTRVYSAFGVSEKKSTGSGI